MLPVDEPKPCKRKMSADSALETVRIGMSALAKPAAPSGPWSGLRAPLLWPGIGEAKLPQAAEPPPPPPPMGTLSRRLRSICESALSDCIRWGGATPELVGAVGAIPLSVRSRSRSAAANIRLSEIPPKVLAVPPDRRVAEVCGGPGVTLARGELLVALENVEGGPPGERLRVTPGAIPMPLLEPMVDPPKRSSPGEPEPGVPLTEVGIGEPEVCLLTRI